MSSPEKPISQIIKNDDNLNEKVPKKVNEYSSSNLNNKNENIILNKIISSSLSKKQKKINSVNNIINSNNKNKVEMNINMNINENNFYPLYITDTKMIEKFNEEKIKKNFHVIVKNQNV